MTHERGYWQDFKDAVAEMKTHDLLIWRLPAVELATALARLSDMRTDEVKLASNWCDGKLFIVRMR